MHPIAASPEATTANPLADAARVDREARQEARLDAARRALRAPIRAIDLLLDDLERVNLRGGAVSSAPEVAAWITRLEAEVGVPAPAWVRSVEDTTRLHAAVLRWQGTLLDQLRPDRAHIGDMHEDPLDLLLLPNAPLRPFLPARLGDRIRRRVA